MSKPINYDIDYQGEDINKTFIVFKIEEDQYQKTVFLRSSEKHCNKHMMKGEKSFEQLLNEYKQKVKDAIKKLTYTAPENNQGMLEKVVDVKDLLKELGLED